MSNNDHGTTSHIPIDFHLNGKPLKVRVPGNSLLLDYLRDDHGLTGAKKACGVEICGACTVLVDGLPVSACTYLTAQIDESYVETIEGLEQEGTLHPAQRALAESGGLQCGFCTPGMVLTIKYLLENHAAELTDRHRIAECLSGNICRCTGYKKIISAVENLTNSVP